MSRSAAYSDICSNNVIITSNNTDKKWDTIDKLSIKQLVNKNLIFNE